MATGGKWSQSVLHASDELVENPCSICLSRDNKSVESTHFCVDCDGNLCKPCKKWHEEFRGTAGHQVVDVSMATGHGGQKAPPLPTERCEEHHGKLLDTYCPTHEQLCCVSCVTFHHGNCGNLQYIPKVSKGVKKSHEYTDIKESANDVTSQLETIRTERYDVLNKLNKEENSSQTSLQKLRQRLIKRIDDLTKIESHKIESEYQGLRDAVQIDIKAVEDQIDSLKACRQKLNEFHGDNESQLFVYIKQFEKNTTYGKEFINTLARIRLSIYKINSTVEKNLNGIQEFGRFERERPLTLNAVPTLTLKAAHWVRITEDKTVCSIRGMCRLPDGSVLLTDYSNSALKQLDSCYKVVRSLNIADSPHDVCYTENNNEIAVTITMKKIVQFVCVGDTLTKTRSFNAGEYCRGICCSNGELFVCCENFSENGSAKICVFTLRGTSLRTLQINQKGQQPLTNMLYITANDNGSKLHVTNKSGVTTVDKNGKILSVYSDAGLCDVRGICTLDGDDILLAELTTQSILYVHSDRTKTETLLREQDGLNQPYAVSFDHVNNYLILGEWGKNKIKVYKVSY